MPVLDQLLHLLGERLQLGVGIARECLGLLRELQQPFILGVGAFFATRAGFDVVAFEELVVDFVEYRLSPDLVGGLLRIRVGDAGALPQRGSGGHRAGAQGA